MPRRPATSPCRPDTPDGDPIASAHLGCERGSSVENGPAVGIVPLACLLTGVSGQLDPDRVCVPAARVPCDVVSRTHWIVVSASTQ